jgi:hypothetical protein
MACTTTDAEDSEEDPFPDLVNESSDDDSTIDHGENQTDCSSDIDDLDMEKLFKDHFDADNSNSSDAESAGLQADTTRNTATTEPCVVCSKPTWCSTFQPHNFHCRDYCMHNAEKHNLGDSHHDAPVMKLDEPKSTLPALSSALMPPEIEEINTQAIKDAPARRLSKKQLKKFARALVPELKPSEMKTLPGSSNDLLKPFDALPAAVATEVHREKQ